MIRFIKWMVQIDQFKDTAPESSARINTGVPNMLGAIYSDNTGAPWEVQSQTKSGVLIYKSLVDGKSFRAYIVRDVEMTKYIIYSQLSTAELQRIETYDIGKWTLRSQETFSTTTQVIVF